MSAPGKLYLLPVPISETETALCIPPHNIQVIKNLKHFIAEDAKTARAHLKAFGYPVISEAEITLLNEHSSPQDLAALGKLLQEGKAYGLMSEAGCPAVADPGADLVRLAHKAGVEVIPLVGPSSILLSVMSSGFNGQNFAFTGYLPLEQGARVKRVRELELLAQKHRQAQYFIETPYRNDKLFSLLLGTLESSTMLFVGRSILSPRQLLASRTVAEWRKLPAPALHKEPAVFGIFK